MHTSELLVVISLVLIFNGWQAWRQERWLCEAMERLTYPSPLRFLPTPQPQELGRELPFMLERKPVRPRFENWGVDISVAPTIALC